MAKTNEGGPIVKKLLRHILLVALTSVGPSVFAQEVFLEGFPDVPLLQGIQEISEERIVFDTLAGTVAQTELAYEGPAKKALDLYNSSLPAFGWKCERAQLSLGCVRGDNKILFTNKNHSENNGRIILRLEPVEQPDMAK